MVLTGGAAAGATAAGGAAGLTLFTGDAATGATTAERSAVACPWLCVAAGCVLAAGCACVICADAGGATTTGGRAITGPTGVLLAIAGGGTTTGIAWLGCRGCGTIRRGAGATGAAATGALTGGTAFTSGAAFATTVGAAAGTTTAGRRGPRRASSAACLRSNIKRAASPGFDMWARLKTGLASTAGLFAVVPLCRPLK